MKQIIVVRDLEITKGKLAAQACHASLGSYKKSDNKAKKRWEREGEKKVVVKAGEKDIRELEKKAKKDKIPSFLVRDAGLTELDPGTITALGLGPSEDKKLDKLTSRFPLLR